MGAKLACRRGRKQAAYAPRFFAHLNTSSPVAEWKRHSFVEASTDGLFVVMNSWRGSRLAV